MTDCMNSACLIHATKHPTVLVVYTGILHTYNPLYNQLNELRKWAKPSGPSRSL